MSEVYGIEVNGKSAEWYITRMHDGKLGVEVHYETDVATAFSDMNVVESAVVFLNKNGYNAKLVRYVKAEDGDE